MSDYGYRPAPPPEDGRPQGQGGRPDGRAYGSGGSGDRQGDYGWGGSQQGGHGQAPRPRQQPYGTPASGSASVGRGSVPPGRGSASVGGRPTGSASVGGGATGSASVGGPGRTGRASVGSASVGSASVGSASVGSASVGSASVRPVSPAGPGERTGRASVTGTRRAGPGSKSDLEGGKKKRKRLGRKMLAVVIALGILGVASITIVGAYFFQTTPTLTGLARDGESSSFYLVDGETQVGAYGDTLRMQAKEGDIPVTVTDALVALEDRKFWEHGGVDYVRTAGALVNNLTGGDMQGASTITQQYAGIYLDARDEISYDRKAREAALAMKMESEYSKKQIITAYLNAAYFGRGAYGIEAAAKNYFNVPLKELDYDQAAFIVMQVKSPNGYYDPYFTEYFDEEASKARWSYTMDALVETGQISQEKRDGYEYPTPAPEFKAGSWGGDTPLGFLINEQDGYVFDELYERYGITKDELGGKDGENGGYKVELTIDNQIQDALVTTGSRGDVVLKQAEDGTYLDADDKPVESADQAAPELTEDGYAQFENSNDEAALKEYKEYMMSAMVAIDPETGAVRGYYGGDDGFGVDKAGAESPHPPSSTMKMITAATAIENGTSIESWFNAGSPREFESLKLDDSEECIGGGDYPECTLRNGSQADPDLELELTDAVRDSKNTPMYAIAEEYGADSILQYAAKMGLTQMSQTRSLPDDNGEYHDVVINYSITGGDTPMYSLHGKAVDAEGNPVVNASGNWNDWADIQVDENCNPEINLKGEFIESTSEEPVACEVGQNGETDPFYYHLSFGQYPTSVRDMAAMYATIANDGYYHETHYVEAVYNNDGQKIEPKRELNEGQAIDAKTAQDLQWVGSEIKGESTVGEDLERDYFGKTGTWEATGEDEDGNKYESGWNAHAWYVGAIKQLAIASWVGNLTSESDPIAGPDGSFDGVFGGNTAYPVWLDAMNRIIDAKDGDEAWEPVDWEGKALNGSAQTWDIENAGINPAGEYCAANPEDTACGTPEEEEDEEACEDGDNGGGNNQECETTPGEGETTTTDPTDENSESGETCLPFQNCQDEETTTPEEGASTTPEEGDNGNGNG
ncbi:transglycosylase domain-containing protein [Glycomyces luteolus]|uniref:Transglycosylase domain-containing protein n=1 Tax=Glycomyces luteolus TaxID=2670330 RepID=A0A9X3PCZ8_9ACTN|nr:transglycosylase domain-containing protein [Glycomyces luteolus]MDA1361253.1 transglycosylase domain-containing protein [Glycomyces luteolus]